MQKKMKDNKEQLKQKIINDVKSRTNLSISWLQKKYGIGFSLAKEIYSEYREAWEHNLRNTAEAIAEKLPKDRADALLEEMNKVISNGGAQRIMLASLIATSLRSKRIQYIVAGNLSSSYLAYELKIHNVDCFKYGIRPEICHGIDYKNNYSIEFRVAPEEISNVLSKLDKDLKGNLLREFTVYKNGKKGVIFNSRYYVVDSSIRSLTEDIEEAGVKYLNCLNNEVARESENRDKLIKIIIGGTALLSIAYECTRKIEERLCLSGKTKKKRIFFSINKIEEENPDLIGTLIKADDNFYLPGFSSDYEYQIIKRTNPKSLNDFIKILCASRGTGAWVDNQELLYKDEKRSLNHLIGSRDDVFDFAISKGINVEESLKIMESVRKGKGVHERYRKIIGDEYFDIFNKTKYLFTRGHILQHIQTVLLVLFFRKNYPLEFFASRLELCNVHKIIDDTLLNGDVIDLEAYIAKMQHECSELDSESKEYKGAVIKDKIRITQLLILMKQEGIKLLKPDFNKSSSNTVLIDYDSKTLLLPLYSLPMSEDVARAIVNEREKENFRSMEDLRRRTGMPASTIEELNNVYFFDGLAWTIIK